MSKRSLATSFETEKAIENRILLFCKAVGIFAWKIQSVGIYDEKIGTHRKQTNPLHIKGVSDIGAVYKGFPIACEVKKPDGTLSPDQRKYIVDFNKAGGIAFVARSLWQFVDQLTKFFPEDRELFKRVAINFEIQPKVEQ